MIYLRLVDLLKLLIIEHQPANSVCGNRRKECHRFWLRLRHAVVVISNDRTSASQKINGMALIRTLTVSATAFERAKNKFDGFRQAEL